MKDLTKQELVIIEQFLEPYRETLEEILASNDVESEAQKQAWIDWSTDLIVEQLGFTEEQAKELLSNLEKEYKLNQLKDE